MNSMNIIDIVFICVIILFCLILLIFNFIIPYYKKNKKPIFRSNYDGLLEYYSQYFNSWRIFYIWNNTLKRRTVHIFDIIHNLEFNEYYTGEGLEGIYYNESNIYQNMFKTNKDIDKNQIKLINKADNYLKFIFKYDVKEPKNI